MFQNIPKNMMNDENFYNKKSVSGKSGQNLSQDDAHRTGIRFARRVRLGADCGSGGDVFLLPAFWSRIFARRLVVITGELGFIWPHLCTAVHLPFISTLSM